MKKKFLPGLLLCLFAIIFCACTNILGEGKKSSDSTGIVLSLPYAKNNKVGVFRAGDATNNHSLKFEVTFKHIDSGTETSFKGKSGEKIIFEKAPIGLYNISVHGYEDDWGEFEGEAEAEVKEGETTTVVIKLKRVDSIIEINLLGWTDEQARMIEKYIETHPDCGIKVIFKQVETTNGQYTSFLDDALSGKSDKFIPDIYTAEAGFVLRYTKGQMSQYALPYKDFIDDVETKISDAQIAQYTVDLGTKSSGTLVGLAYQTTGGAFIYRRSVAKTVFGTDTPDEVKAQIGGGTGSWTKFWQAAESCGDKGVAIVSGDGDLWHPVEGSADDGWVVDGKLHIDSKRAAFLDYSKDLYTNGWSNKSSEWTTDWYNDARGNDKSRKPVLGFFGPAWLINYVLEPACNKDDDGKIINNDTDWAICESPVGFFWGGTWMLANKKLAEDTSDEGKKKLEAVRKLIEWITLDTSESGLQYQWANGLMENSKDTVASKVVMDKSDGSLDFLGGLNMFDYYNTANAKAHVDLLTEYDEAITALWRFEVNKYAEGLTTKDQALNNFKYSVYTKLGLEWEGFDASDLVYETEHIKAEPDPDGKGIKITLTCKDGENWQPYASFINETDKHFGIRIVDVPTPKNPVVVYYPLTESNKGYNFEAELVIDNGKKVIEQFIAMANGGNKVFEIEGENFDISLDGRKLKLSKDLAYTLNKSNDVHPYFNYSVYTTNKNTGKERWEVDWKQWLNSGDIDFTDEAIESLQTEGYTVLNLTSDVYNKLKEDTYYFVNLTVEFTIDGIPESFRTWTGAYTDVMEADFDELVSNQSDHILSEPDPDGKGVRFTISAKAGEVWRKEGYRITEINSGLYMEINENKLPSSDKPVVCYWPFTNDGETYLFDCEVKLESEGQNVIHESLASTANGSYADVAIDFAAAKESDVIIDSANATAKFTKNISSSISYSDTVTATFDFGTFANESSTEYKWTEWMSSRFIPVNNADLYGNGAGISLFDLDKDTVLKLKKHKYFFTEVTLNLEIEGIEDRFRSSNVYRTEIIDSSDFITNINTNTHISAEPDENGVKITLQRLSTDNDWRGGNVLICLAEDGQDGVNLELARPEEFENGVIPEEKYGNRCPTAAEATVTYIYPFTERGKVYEFVLAGPLDKENHWQSEYVCCEAGGGLGELIDYDEWNNNVKVTDIVADAANQNFSFKVQGDVADIIDNSTGAFAYAEFCPDVRPGVEGADDVDHRGKTFGYASRRVILIGTPDDYNRGPEAFNSAFVVESRPDYEELDPDDYDYDDVYAELANWDNTFYVIMSIQRIQLKDSNMQFHLHWK